MSDWDRDDHWRADMEGTRGPDDKYVKPRSAAAPQATRYSNVHAIHFLVEAQQHLFGEARKQVQAIIEKIWIELADNTSDPEDSRPDPEDSRPVAGMPPERF